MLTGEPGDNLSDLSVVLRYLGPCWKVIFSDFAGDSGSNRERLAFVYDQRAVTFTGLASQVQPPRRKHGTEYVSEISWWRPPYMASFRSGSFDFVLVAAHIRWASDGEEGRVPELKLLADWVHQRTQDQYMIDKDIIVEGDLNVPRVGGPAFTRACSRETR